MSPTNHLTDRIARGEFDFFRFVEILSTKGFITEAQNDPRCPVGSNTMEYLQQDEFDALFSFFLPRQLNDIELACAATNRGSVGHAYSYALFNANAISREEVLDILERENRERNSQAGL